MESVRGGDLLEVKYEPTKVVLLQDICKGDLVILHSARHMWATSLHTREYFFTNEQINGGNVLMENYVSCKTIDTLETNRCKYSIVSTICHLVNRSPASVINFKTPEKVWSVIGYKWVFKKKRSTLNSDDVRYKVRLVAKGYNQVEGIDYNDIFSPTIKHNSIRV
ncbi:unnamed protein product [Spirodela intermedia]|uniref:Reverse transcriptase Ty1/copia-type domain-containing protein n=1 Tax=Spirodela intermedia TaxID=51605 RepID=A0A7I8K3F5_SPIIN|nr:unnamed protein product [Spirodela intermedia]